MTPETPNSTGNSEMPVSFGLENQPGTQRKIIALMIGSDRTIRLDKERLVIGSVISADVRLTGDGVAPIHAVLENTEQATLYDLASDTGVFVNGKKAVTQVLKPGDRIKIGVHTLEFQVEDAKSLSSKELFRVSEGRKLFLNAKEDFSPLLLESEHDIDEIFDYRPTHKRALEVVMSWNEVILDVEHFTDEEEVVLGDTRKSDFAIPPILSSKTHSLVQRDGDGYVLNLDPKMSGVIQRKGVLQTLDTLGNSRIPLAKEDFAKLSVGDIEFYLSFTSAPPRLKMSKMFERDPLVIKILGSSLLLTIVTVVSLLSAHVPQSLEAEQLPDRIATILYQPEKYVQRPKIEKAEEKVAAAEPKMPEPQPTTKLELKPNPANEKKPIPERMNLGSQTKKQTIAKKSPGQNQAKEGRGARAKGKEGARGSKTAPAMPNQQPQNQANRPSPQGGPGKGAGDSQVPDIGNVDFLKGASGKIEQILGNSAAKLGKGGERLKGFGGFNTQGNDGLALVGTGKGGGGTAEGLGGLSDKGRGGGRVGTGMGAAGSGSGIIGGQSRVVIRSGGPEEAVVMGTIDADAVEAALLAHKDEFRLCYEREINAEHPSLAGRVGTTFVIGSSGKVTQAGVASTTLQNQNAEGCILSVIKRIQFPVPRGAGVVQVSYPFKFVAQR